MAVYGELGRYPLYINRYFRVIKYWFKLLTTSNCILKAIYELLLSQCNNGVKNLMFYVKNVLFIYGFGYVWCGIQPYSGQIKPHISLDM